tara:strand:+ start:190 stop:1407 length:1218 start_codon:yes stop_codon:yes gene_type:complete
MNAYDDASLIVYPSGYKESKIYAQKPIDGTGDLTFARASSATRVNEQGLIESVAINVPRIDYTGGGCGKLLLEPQRTNTIPYSEDFATGWSNIGANIITSNATTSPTGDVNAYKIVEGNTFGQHYLRLILGGHTVGAAHTLSVFAKAGELDVLTLRLFQGGDGNVTFDLTNGVITAGTNGAIEDYGNGWYRCIAYHSSATSTYLYPYLYVLDGNAQGDGTSGVYWYGAQLEEGSYATSYIPTSGTTVTRVEDKSSTTGLSSVIGQAEGVLYAEFSPLGLVNAKNLFVLYQDANNRLGFYTRNSNQLWAFMNSSGASQFDMSTGATVSVGSVYKVAFAYKVNDVSIFVNGVEVMADTSVNMPSSLSQFTFNLQQLSTAFGAEMTINQAQLYKTRLDNATLATLTTL